MFFPPLFVLHKSLVTSDPILWVTQTTWKKHEQKRHSANETEQERPIHVRAHEHIDTYTHTHIHMHGIRRMRCQWNVQQFSSQQFYTQQKSTSSSTDQHQHNINCTKQKSNEKPSPFFRGFQLILLFFVLFCFKHTVWQFSDESKKERQLKN